MSDYTPTTEDIRYEWRWSAPNPDEADEEFDRWLAAHDRQVRAETWDEAIQAVFDWWSTPEDEQGVIVNPYGVHPADRLMQEIEKEAGL